MDDPQRRTQVAAAPVSLPQVQERPPQPEIERLLNGMPGSQAISTTVLGPASPGPNRPLAEPSGELARASEVEAFRQRLRGPDGGFPDSVSEAVDQFALGAIKKHRLRAHEAEDPSLFRIERVTDRSGHDLGTPSATPAAPDLFARATSQGMTTLVLGSGEQHVEAAEHVATDPRPSSVQAPSWEAIQRVAKSMTGVAARQSGEHHQVNQRMAIDRPFSPHNRQGHHGRPGQTATVSPGSDAEQARDWREWVALGLGDESNRETVATEPRRSGTPGPNIDVQGTDQPPAVEGKEAMRVPMPEVQDIIQGGGRGSGGVGGGSGALAHWDVEVEGNQYNVIGGRIHIGTGDEAVAPRLPHQRPAPPPPPPRPTEVHSAKAIDAGRRMATAAVGDPDADKVTLYQGRYGGGNQNGDGHQPHRQHMNVGLTT